MMMMVTTIINISIVLHGALRPYEIGSITFHFTVEVTMRLAEFVWLVYAKIILFKGIE